MKIVHCIWSFNTGGAETMLVDIANEQAKTQDVTIIIVNDSYQKYLIDKLSSNVKIIFIHQLFSASYQSPENKCCAFFG